MTAPGSGQEQVEEVTVAIYTRLGVHRWTTSAAALCFDATPGSPWLLVPPAVRSVFDSLVSAGIPLADSVFGPPMLGVKCGCNDAFIVTLDARSDRGECDDRLAAVGAVSARDSRAIAHHGWLERSILRPVVRGETLGRWVRRDDAGQRPPPRPVPSTGRRRGSRQPEWIIWTHEDTGDARARPLAVLPRHAASWLGRWRHQLAARSDTRGQVPWWALFRTESASSMQPRVVWPDLGRAPRATLIPAGDPTVALNSCYIARARDLVDAQALTALLNSAIAGAWLNILAEPARGGYRRYMGWTVGLLPLPQPWERARSVMAPLAAAALAGSPPTEARLTETVAAAYGLDLDALRPLLSWSGA